MPYHFTIDTVFDKFHKNSSSHSPSINSWKWGRWKLKTSPGFVNADLYQTPQNISPVNWTNLIRAKPKMCCKRKEKIQLFIQSLPFLSSIVFAPSIIIVTVIVTALLLMHDFRAKKLLAKLKRLKSWSSVITYAPILKVWRTEWPTDCTLKYKF